MAILSSSVLFLMVGAHAHADSFVGASMGQAYYPNFVDEDTATVTQLVRNANPGLSVSGHGTQDKTGFGYKLFGGTWINDHVGVEVGYADLGKPTETVTTSGVSTVWTAKVKSTALYGAALVGSKFGNGDGTVFLKLGAYQSKSKIDYSVIGPGGSAGLSQSTNGSGGLIGFGASSRIANGLDLRVEFEHFDKVKISDSSKADVNLLTLGLVHPF
jgi:hypothetical protein